MLNIPIHVVEDICYYLNPNRLHRLALHSHKFRHIINGKGGGNVSTGVDRSRYIEKWLDTIEKLHNYIFTNIRYSYIYNVSCDNIVYEIENMWYFRLKINISALYNLVKRIKFIKDKRIYLYIDDRYNYLDRNPKIIGSVDIEDGAFDGVHTINIICLNMKIKLEIFAKCHTLFIANNIDNIHVLCNVHTLIIHNNYWITDVSALGNLHSLYISHCTSLFDVSALGDLYSLDISGHKDLFKSLVGIDKLGSIHSLDLSYTNVTDTDIIHLGNVHTLSIYGCKNIYDINKCVKALANTYELCVSCFDELFDVSALGNVKYLDLSKSSNLENVGMLGNVNTLDISKCVNIKDVSALGGVSKLNLAHYN